jgi:LysR family glycine cleavage system transcriptional activator
VTRCLPPLNAIRAFEAAARHGSFTRAAEELGVTQGAISRHVSTLETWLGVKLFFRVKHGIQLTPKGVEYNRSLGITLDRLDQATRQIRGVPDARTLRLKLPPTFAIRWFVPRLARFHARYPDIDVQITTSHTPLDFLRQDIDLCIVSGAAPPGGLYSRPLFGEMLVLACSPGLLGGAIPLDGPQCLTRHVFLCSINRPRDWATWLDGAGLPQISGSSRQHFENSALAYQAAIDGLGVVVAQWAFVAEDVRSGRLVVPLDIAVPTEDAYHIVCQKKPGPASKIRALEEWLTEEAAETEASMRHIRDGAAAIPSRRTERPSGRQPNPAAD